ncbi:hypothetical protein STAS_25034 [Striga asiatica]|uniref:Uncharacterized protein n=1 Tax=Striga asiatica TaxID=4170 RepID=A0A5A7QRN8_STRAF|nr:hypothetical protein STAS_25034 [Striga asiatica]
MIVNEEYLCAVRTQSFADCCTKFQLLVNEKPPPLSPPPADQITHSGSFSQVLLQPSQKAIASILDSSSLFSKSSSDGLKSLLLNYFDTSSEASDFCSRLLETLTHLRTSYGSIAKIIDSIGHDGSPTLSELRSSVFRQNPLSDLKGHNIEHLRGRQSSVLRGLKSSRRAVARKIRTVRIINRTSGVCCAAACGVLAAAAVFLAAHTLGAILVGPAVLGLRGRGVRFGFRFVKCEGRYLRRAAGQLDAAAKGAYILDRDLETMSRLVGRLGDEIEHGKGMVMACLDDRVCLEVLKEMRKDGFGLGKKVEELEEHVYLCLVTINRARAMLVKEISKDVV